MLVESPIERSIRAIAAVSFGKFYEHWRAKWSLFGYNYEVPINMFEALADIGPLALDNLNETALQLQGDAEPAITSDGAAALGIGLAAIGAGYAERGIGAAAVGALAEDSISTGIGIVMTVLPETLVIFALVALFV